MPSFLIVLSENTDLSAPESITPQTKKPLISTFMWGLHDGTLEVLSAVLLVLILYLNILMLECWFHDSFSDGLNTSSSALANSGSNCS